MAAGYENVKVLVVDDHPVVARGTAALLSSEPCITVVGSAADGDECLKLADKMRPDIILLDINLPDVCGVDLIEKLKHRLPDIKIIMFTGQQPEEYVTNALNRGAQGFILKDCAGTEMTRAILKVHSGDVYFPQHTLKSPVTNRENNQYSQVESLSPREIDIMELVAKGQPNKEIACNLKISVKTVEYHVSNVLSKLGVGSRIEAVLTWKQFNKNIR